MRTAYKKISLKKKLRNRLLTLGSWLTFPSLEVTEIMCEAGFEWLVIDMEHSAITLDKTQAMVRVIESKGVTPLVRVGENDEALIKRVMDTGAHGVVVPMVNSRQDALRAVSSVKYPPLGKRGVGLARAQGYGVSFYRYKKWVNSGSIVIVQIENIAGVKNLASILRVDEVDGLIVGPYDLSASLGLPGEFEREEVQQECSKVIKIAKQYGKSAGFHVIEPNEKHLVRRVREGYSFLGFSLDTLFLARSCETALSKAKLLLKALR